MNWIKLSATAVLAASAVALAAFNFSYSEPGELNIGEPFPLGANPLVQLDGSTTILRSQMKQNGLLVVFSCNTCPFVLQWEDRYNELYDLCAENNIGMVLLNSNEAKRTGDDSLEKMNEKAQAKGYKMPYLLDANHKLADAFGARTTPHVFLFSRHAKLAYRGAIDNNSESKAGVTEHYLRDAITAVAADQPCSPEVTKAVGCSIKRVVN